MRWQKISAAEAKQIELLAEADEPGSKLGGL